MDSHPKLVFLMETKLDAKGTNRLRYKFNIFGVGVPAVGRSGGLVLLWEKDVSITLLSLSKNHIDVNVQLDANGPVWRFTGFYGEPGASLRKRT